MQIIRGTEIHETKTMMHHFVWADSPGSGFAFDLAEDGSLLRPDNADAYAMCLAGADLEGRRIIDRGILEHVNTWRSPAVGLCDVCGAEVELDGFTCTCECGADYNSFGQRLAPREQWGEETGESLSDIMRIR